MLAIAIVLSIALTAFLAWALFSAQRLNRLHIRTDSARAALQAALNRRAVVLATIAPEHSEIAQHAESVNLLTDGFEARFAAEKKVSAAIKALEGAHPTLIDANVRLQLAHRFYNEAVADTRALRLRTCVRVFHLGGTAALPEFFEFPN